jgi:coenzyme F420-reducing hydrogenase alpha subunit
MTGGKQDTSDSGGRNIEVNEIARVEGGGDLYVEIEDDEVRDVKLKIFEPPRFFEALLEGRSFTEAPDITARICGICPIAYQMSSSHAMEDACNVRVTGMLRELRRLIYCSEWIESHGLHIYMLHAPDFLGYDGAVEMAEDHREAVQRGLQLKKAGNDLMSLLGGREIHPINPAVGGFYRVPDREELESFRPRLEKAKEAAIETVRWVSSFDFPDSEYPYDFVSLRHPDEYPFNEGRIVSSSGLDIGVDEFEEHFMEEHVDYTNALHCTLDDGSIYFVGPMARYNLNYDRLPCVVREEAERAGVDGSCRNPYRSIIVRALEVLFSCEEALRIIDHYERPEVPREDVEPVDGRGYGATEAPRGLLYHRYDITDEGNISSARIIPPTSQNQKTIERDLREFVPDKLGMPDDQLALACEEIIRNYDPCISCATHFLDLKRISPEDVNRASN